MRHLASVLLLLSVALFAFAHDDEHEDPEAIPLPLLEQQLIALYQPEALMSSQAYWLDHQQQLANSFLSAMPKIIGDIKTDQLGKDTGSQEITLGISLPLWWANERPLAIQAAQQLARWKLSELAAQRQQLRLDLYRVSEAYVGARETLHHAKLAVEHAQSLLTHVKARQAAGDLSEFDRVSADADWQQRQQNLLMAEQTFIESQLTFTQLTGQTALPHIGEQPVAFASQFNPESCASILNKRNTAEFIMAQLKQSEQAASHKPELTLSSTQEKPDRFSATDTLARMSISIPLGITAHRAQESSRFGYELAQARTELAQTQRELSIQWLKFYTRFTQSKQQLQQQQKLNKTVSQQYQMAQAAFLAGELDLRELLRIKSSWLEGQHTAELLKYGQIFSALALKALQEDTGR